jgi:hypothetical protein
MAAWVAESVYMTLCDACVQIWGEAQGYVCDQCMHDPSEDSGVYYAINDRWHEGGHNMRAQRTMG